MSLARPHFIVLDSATLGKVSRDYWSPEKVCRDKARTFVARLQDRCVYITFTFTHVLELLRHENDSVVRDRMRFLRQLPCIAWLRPYDRSWFPGGVPDLLRLELHAVVHEEKRDWRAIVEHVRTDVWETGLGSEMFIDNDYLWSAIRTTAQHLQRHEVYVASVVRTDPGKINGLTLGEAKRLPKRPKVERVAYARRFAKTMKVQLEQHGDNRLEDSAATASAFTNDIINDLQLVQASGDDTIQRMLDFRGVPKDLVSDHMTFDDIGELTVYINQLANLSQDLSPRAAVTVYDAPIDSLPSYVLQRRLAKVQRKATRVSGSDLGDSYIAPVVLYAHGVEVDKRTCEYLRQVKRDCPAIAGLMGCYFRTTDYADIPDRCGVGA